MAPLVWNEEDWRALTHAINQGDCILMLGPDASTETVDGREIPLTALLARQIAQSNRPDEPAPADSDLAHEAQLYCSENDRFALQLKVKDFYEARKDHTCQLLRDLAALPFHLAVTSTPDMHYPTALREVGKEPHLAHYNFRGRSTLLVPTQGTPEKPLVYYLYGHNQDASSLVLTENDLLEFLVAVVSERPAPAMNVLSELRDKNKSLLFLGFGFWQWYLRVLLHAVEGKEKECRSFALEQLDKGAATMDFQRTVLFFRKSRYRIHIQHQDLNAFVRELKERWLREVPPETAIVRQRRANAPTVFLCHASEDKAAADELFGRLEAAGLNPWLDQYDLRGGDQWDSQIEAALARVNYFVALQSRALAGKVDSYVNKEIAVAKRRQDRVRKPATFIFSCQIEDCSLLDDLAEFQVIDMRDGGGAQALVQAIQTDMERRQQVVAS